MTSLQAIKYAKDYQQPAYFIDKTFLCFELSEGSTRVTSRLLMRKNPSVISNSLVLDGQNLELESLSVNGHVLAGSQYCLYDESLEISADVLSDVVELRCVTTIFPEKNTSLEGLYRSRGMYCTQCEAEGFRKITYYIDRPDVMSEFEVTIVADQDKFPVMLSNGNCISDAVENGKRKVVWYDPFKKPCYLFALVAGDLACLQDEFITQSGRKVDLRIYVETKDLDKCDFAMDSLKRAMKWDEEVYGREYDLDIFMIVAVDDFNMGAMENKGLNIFNTSCVLASPASTTDDGFERVEAVVAHEYFHNWSGNRVTCRDWFQLSLKEGFTVYRDAEFSSDMNSRDVKRIEDVMFLRAVQFAEDAGPMSHPVRPDSYMEISNFYTVTIYEKGAEVVRMMANLLGRELFRKGTDLYFARHDGRAVTCEDFVLAMEAVSGIDLAQFRLWYSQSGTPLLEISDSYDAKEKRYILNVKQNLPATPGQLHKLPFHIPLGFALFGKFGALPLYGSTGNAECNGHQEIVLSIVDSERQFIFENVNEKPVPSLLRGFSAPIKLRYEYSDEQLAHLIAVDNDGFSRWDAMQTLAAKIIISHVNKRFDEPAFSLLLQALDRVLVSDVIDDSMKALMLSLPSEQYLADFFDQVDPQELYLSRKNVQLEIARKLKVRLLDSYHADTGFVMDVSARARSRRSLGNVALSYLSLLDESDIHHMAWQQFQKAETMTDQLSALKVLVNMPNAVHFSKKALEDFYVQWQHEPLVVNLWLQVQATADNANALSCVRSLLSHPAFDITNPNKVRALIAAFCSQNTYHFHRADGEGYAFLREQVLQLDKLNPQIASRLLIPLTRWQKVDAHRAKLMQNELKMLSTANLSKDVFEVVSKSLLN